MRLTSPGLVSTLRMNPKDSIFFWDGDSFERLSQRFMSQGIRQLIKGIDLQAFVRTCHRKTGLPHELLQDATCEILAALLEREEHFQGRFENQRAFLGYVRKSAIRRAIQANKSQYDVEELPTTIGIADDMANAEEQIVAALELQAYAQLVEHALQATQADAGLLRDGHLLIQTIMAAPDRFLYRRKSGKNKGHWVFHYAALTEALQWNKQRLYDRLERIRQLLIKERNKRDTP